MGVCTGPRWRPGAALWVTSLLVLLSFSSLVAEIRGDICGAANDATLSEAEKKVPVSSCKNALFNTVLRFQEDDKAQTLNVILSAPKAARWYGIGFNQDPNVMPGTHAITFWMDSSGTPRTTNHYLSATGFGGVGDDSTSSNPLTFVQNPSLTSSSDTYYLSFVVNKPSNDARFNNVVLALSDLGNEPTGSSFNNQNQHQSAKSLSVDYSTGIATVVAAPSDKKLKAHGITNIIGWGVLLPLGMIIARYGRRFDPAWFYMHAVFQCIGYIFVAAGFGLGLNIYNQNKGEDDLDTHRAIGIALFVLATIQVSAGIIRPKKDAKIRRYWNWGHFWLGRSALVIGVANIFFGIHVADSSKSWKVAYGVILAFEVALLVPLEILYWVKLRKYKKADQVDQHPGNHHTNGRRSDIESSAPPPVFDGENTWNNVKY